MKLTWLGTGSAGTLLNWQTNALIEFDSGFRLAVDAGDDFRHALFDQGMTYHDVHGFYVSHLHGDHCHGLEIMGFNTFFDPTYDNRYDTKRDIPRTQAAEMPGRPILYYSEALTDDLWAALRPGLRSLQKQIGQLSTYFKPRPVERNGTFKMDGVEFRLVQTIHCLDGYAFNASFGLLFPMGSKQVFITTDTQHAPTQIKDFYDAADVIFHDCETSFASGVHAHFDELCELPDETKEKIWLVHYGDNVLASDPAAPPHRRRTAEISRAWHEKAAAAGFRGIVARGTVFTEENL